MNDAEQAISKRTNKQDSFLIHLFKWVGAGLLPPIQDGTLARS